MSKVLLILFGVFLIGVLGQRPGRIYNNNYNSNQNPEGPSNRKEKAWYRFNATQAEQVDSLKALYDQKDVFIMGAGWDDADKHYWIDALIPYPKVNSLRSKMRRQNIESSVMDKRVTVKFSKPTEDYAQAPSTEILALRYRTCSECASGNCDADNQTKTRCLTHFESSDHQCPGGRGKCGYSSGLSADGCFLSYRVYCCLCI